MKKWEREAHMWPLENIKPYHQNAKQHLVGCIATSLEEFDVDQPIVVDGDGVIIKGHGRLKAAKQIGLSEFPVIVRTDLTPEQVRLARLADNRSAEGGYDADNLKVELSELMSLLPEIDFDALGINNDWEFMPDLLSQNVIEDIVTVDNFNEEVVIKIICVDWNEYEEAVRRIGKKITYAEIKERLK